MTTRRAAAALAALVLLLVGCRDGSEVASDVCEEPVEPPLQEAGHLLGDTPPPVPYSSTPPTSGWHASGGVPPPGLYEVQLPDPAIVSVLERGGVVVTHAGPLDGEARAAVAALLDEVDALVVTPYALDEQQPPVTLLAWGVLQRCDELEPGAVRAFADAHGGTDLGH